MKPKKKESLIESETRRILLCAVRCRAEEVRMESSGDGCRVRFLIGGEERDEGAPPRSFFPRIMAHLQEMASIYSSGGLSQKGRIYFHVIGSHFVTFDLDFFSEGLVVIRRVAS